MKLVRPSLAVVAVGALLAGCATQTATPQPSPTPTATPMPSPASTVGTNPTPSAPATTATDFDITWKALYTSAKGTPTGTGTVTMSPDEKTVTIAVTASNLSVDPFMAHIHKADTPGGVGDVVKDLKLERTDTNIASVTWTTTDDNQPLTAELVQALKDGKCYINFHTQTHPDGELRGDLKPKM